MSAFHDFCSPSPGKFRAAGRAADPTAPTHKGENRVQGLRSDAEIIDFPASQTFRSSRTMEAAMELELREIGRYREIPRDL
jgi:hypothetical protein